MKRLDYGPDVPTWAVTLFEQLAQRADDRMTRPHKLLQTTTANLPDATKFAGSVMHNTTLGVPVISDGVHWFPVTVGAHL